MNENPTIDSLQVSTTSVCPLGICDHISDIIEEIVVLGEQFNRLRCGDTSFNQQQLDSICETLNRIEEILINNLP